MPTVKSLCNLARQSIKEGSFERAILLARHVLQHYPKSIEVHCLLGEVCAERGDAAEAERYFKLTLSADPEQVTAMVGLGLAYRDQGHLEGAIAQFEHALELQPENQRLWREIRRLANPPDDAATDRGRTTRGALGRIYLRSGLYQRAAKELRAVLDADPERLDIAMGLAEAQWRAELYAEAAETCRNTLGLAPDCLKSKLLLAEMGSSGARSIDPQAMIDEARALDPDNHLASVLFAEMPSASRWALSPAELPLPEETEPVVEPEEPKDSAADSPAAVVDTPKETVEIETPVMPVLREADRRLTIARLRSALVANPGDQVSRLSLAVALGRLGEVDEALDEFERLLVAAPEALKLIISGLREILASGADRPKLHRLLADAYMKDGAFGEAIEHYALALEK